MHAYAVGACVRVAHPAIVRALLNRHRHALPQGIYSFVIYDSNRKQVFAARDPSGKEPLFYSVDEDEALRSVVSK